MNIEEKAKEILRGKLTDIDLECYLKGSPLTYNACLEAVKEAINYTHCSTQLKDKKTMTINKWTEDNGYKHSFTDCYIKGDDWFTGKQMWQKYNEAMKSL